VKDMRSLLVAPPSTCRCIFQLQQTEPNFGDATGATEYSTRRKGAPTDAERGANANFGDTTGETEYRGEPTATNDVQGVLLKLRTFVGLLW
jgi:hypothetical protein